MDNDPLMNRARRLWESLAGVPVSFAPSGGPVVVTAPASALAPPSWVGTVLLGDAALVTAPTDEVAHVVRRALRGLPAAPVAGAPGGVATGGTGPRLPRTGQPVERAAGRGLLSAEAGRAVRARHGAGPARPCRQTPDGTRDGRPRPRVRE